MRRGSSKAVACQRIELHAYVCWKTVTTTRTLDAAARIRSSGGRCTPQEQPLAKTENYLIELLPRADRLRLEAICEPVDLQLSEVLCARGATIKHVYFPVHGFISLLTQVDQHASLEVGMVGREGMFGAEVALGMLESPLLALVQGPGAAWRVNSVAFRRELVRSKALREGVLRYLRVVLAQMASSAACPALSPDPAAPGTLAADERRPGARPAIPRDS